MVGEGSGDIGKERQAASRHDTPVTVCGKPDRETVRELREPPLHAVRAFEAAGRHGSFTAAGAELGLTQSAISRHIRLLEEHLGTQLFHRHGRSVALNERGLAYHSTVSEAFSRLRRASAAVARHPQPRVITLSVLPSVAAFWLAPRLSRFRERFPDIKVVMHGARDRVEPGGGSVDLAIRYGTGPWPNVRADLLAREWLTPVCSPDFAQMHDLFGNPERLRGLPLLTDRFADEWQPWLDRAGLDPDSMTFDGSYDETASLYEVVAAGGGVTLGRSLLIGELLRRGRLTAPFPLTTPARAAYWMVSPSRGEIPPPSRLFIRWLREEAKTTLKSLSLGDPAGGRRTSNMG